MCLGKCFKIFCTQLLRILTCLRFCSYYKLIYYKSQFPGCSQWTADSWLTASRNWAKQTGWTQTNPYQCTPLIFWKLKTKKKILKAVWKKKWQLIYKKNNYNGSGFIIINHGGHKKEARHFQTLKERNS